MMRRRATIGQAGFTLMEVVVALAILAIAMAGLIKAAGGGASNLAYLEDKTLAHWVAMNRVAEEQIKTTATAMGRSTGQETMAGRDWEWAMDVNATEDSDVLRLDVEVRRNDDPETIYARLRGYTMK